MEYIAQLLLSEQAEWNDHIVVSDDEDESVDSSFLLDTQDEVRQLFSSKAIPSTSQSNVTSNCSFDVIANMDLKERSLKCQICEYELRSKKRRSNVLFCKFHKVRACGIKRGPRKKDRNCQATLLRHDNQEPVTDFSWILGDDDNLTCMEKFHTLYLPAKLYLPEKLGSSADGKTKFVRVRRASELFNKRQKALGITTQKLGRKKGTTKRKRSMEGIKLIGDQEKGRCSDDTETDSEN
jgi:hypothetical protein